MGNGLGDARRAYEAAKRIKDACGTMWPAEDAKILFTNASQDYAQALVDDAQRKLDAMGVVIGETMCCVPGDDVTGRPPFIVTRLEAVQDDGLVFAFGDDGKCVSAVHIRPYVAPVVKEMVMPGSPRYGFGPEEPDADTHHLTLSNVTPADLDAMKPGDVIEGTYKIERMQ